MAQQLFDIKNAVRDFLITIMSDIVGGSGDIPIDLNDFAPDTGQPAIMVRDSSGPGPDIYMPISNMAVFIFVRAENPVIAETILRRLDSKLHRYGPAAFNDDVFCSHAERNTDLQLLPDPNNNDLTQYFIRYTKIVKENADAEQAIIPTLIWRIRRSKEGI